MLAQRTFLQKALLLWQFELVAPSMPHLSICLVVHSRLLRHSLVLVQVTRSTFAFADLKRRLIHSEIKESAILKLSNKSVFLLPLFTIPSLVVIGLLLPLLVLPFVVLVLPFVVLVNGEQQPL